MFKLHQDLISFLVKGRNKDCKCFVQEVMGGDRERVISWKPNEEKRRGWVSDVTRVSRRHKVSSKFNMWMSVVVELRSGCCRRGSK